ncbi:hypothetical protein EVAR_85108_1 [Eumeta japonica]|uniref:Uncharacterized protein n=1 Tax=Eumeta variegata TaxID=151549 RepID=A0A4C1XRQ2_EUMVA|nr:hypothetical protein EVAR_85108_1 [Eumeta japonica]
MTLPYRNFTPRPTTTSNVECSKWWCSPVQISTVSGSGIDIASKTKSRIEIRDRMRTESRTQPWLESSVELKLEPRGWSESEYGTVRVRNQSGTLES